MSDSTIAKRYAKAVFELASEKKLLEKVMADLVDLVKLIAETEVLKSVVNNPVLSKDALAQAFEDILKKIKSQKITSDFINVLVRNGRISTLPAVASAYEELLKDSKGEVTAVVTTALPVSKKRMGEIEKALGKSLGKAVNVESLVDESILGGIVIRIGSKMLDASVLGGLEKIEIISKNAIANC